MSKLEDMVTWAVSIANDDSHGYDQVNRWGPDYDCSSLVISAVKKAGYDVGSATYTGNMTSNLTKSGFEKITNIDKRQRGDILLNVKHHTALYLGDGKLVHASINENGKAVGGKTGDQTKREICIREYYDYPWDCILRPPKETTVVPTKTMDELVSEVIQGKWGNGTERKKRLTEAGYNYEAIQKEVNEMTKKSTKKTETTISKTVKVNTSLNVRSGAGMTYSIIGSLTNGDSVDVISESDGWSKIKYGTGTAFVKSDYLV